MSVEALIARLAPAEFDDVRATPETASERLWNVDEAQLLDLELYWNPLGVMMSEARFPINPMHDGAPFPTARHAFGTIGDSMSLTAIEVKQLADHLRAVSYDDLSVHLIALPENENWFTVDPEGLAAIDFHCRRIHRKLVDFYATAADRGERTVYWTA
jgi:hypothetical protein